MNALADGTPRVTLQIPPVVRMGASVRIVVHIENDSAGPVELYLRGREITWDISVTSERGDVVWRRLHDQVVPAILRLEIIEAGRLIELSETWDQRDNSGDRVSPGVYAVTATVLSDGSTTFVSPAVALRIDEGDRRDVSAARY